MTEGDAIQPERTTSAAVRDHLFISYATEDWPLAEWLTRRLTADGYRVWCDRFKLLGGESYPRDIDKAIEERTFRLIALLSRASKTKDNPVKERTKALKIGKALGIADFLIPLNVDGIAAAELDWMTTDLTFIPFHPSWAEGLRQLLHKLETINAPHPLANGREIAIASFLPVAVLSESPETLFTNHLRFTQIPAEILRLTLSRPLTPLEQQVVTEGWAYYAVSATTLFALTLPPGNLPGSDRITLDNRIAWRTTQEADGINTANVVSSLLYKSVLVEYIRRGLRPSPNHAVVYFPPGLLRDDKLFFPTYDGTTTWLLVTGERTYRRRGEVQRYRYHLSPRLRVRRDIAPEFLLQITPGLYLTDLDGSELDPRVRNSRRKQLCRGWWNHQWLNRHLAVVSFLSDGKEAITIGEAPEEQTVITARLNSGPVPIGIDETALESWRATFSSSAPFDEGGATDDGEEAESAENDDDW